MSVVLSPRQAWRRLAHMRSMVVRQPDLAWAVNCMSLYDQLELTLELLRASNWPNDADVVASRSDIAAARSANDDDTAVAQPSNVVRFRPRRPR